MNDSKGINAKDAVEGMSPEQMLPAPWNRRDCGCTVRIDWDKKIVSMKFENEMGLMQLVELIQKDLYGVKTNE